MKALYSTPLPDVSHVAPVSETILTSGEVVERWRWEEEKERRMLNEPRQPTLTQDQDEVHVHFRSLPSFMTT